MHMIAYVSEATFPEQDTLTTMEDICEKSQKFNASKSISGVIFYENRHFVQVIEGEEHELRCLMAKICRDSRHSEIEYFVDEPVSERSFNDWSMDTFYVETPGLVDRDVIKTLHRLHTKMFTLNAKGLITFTKTMIDELDVYNIKAAARIR